MKWNNLIFYINPISRLGYRKYSIVFPFLLIISTCLLSEFYAYQIAKNPNIVGNYIIFITVALTLYSSFRDGIRGGLIISIITIFYYFYIVHSRHYKGEQLTSGVETTIILAFLYIILAGIVGGLKETIDKLIEREADEKRRLEVIIEQLPVGVVVANNKGVVELTNKRLEQILGTSQLKGLIAGKDMGVVTKYDNKQIKPSQSPLAQVLNTGKSIVDKEFTIQREDGRTVYINVGASAIKNKKGKVIAAASIINDITHQKELDVRKDDFVNMASHELKTPITSMKLYIDLLLNRITQYNDESASKTLKSIRYQTSRLQALVNDLLDVSRLQTGKMSLNRELFNLGDLIEETIDALQQTSKNQKLIFAKRASIKVNADRFRIYQVFTNLITNAIKYSPQGSDIIIEINKEKNKAVVSVQDSGMGIPSSQQRKIFERLYQVTEPDAKTFPGLGMGLFISSEIIKKHKGTIWVKSEKGKGSTFYFSLPIFEKKKI